jgi:calcium/calmodulin-dependent protein kinase I
MWRCKFPFFFYPIFFCFSCTYEYPSLCALKSKQQPAAATPQETTKQATGQQPSPAPTSVTVIKEAESNLPHSFKARYKLGDVLGQGAFSTVKMATSKINGEKFAVKVVNRASLPKDDEEALKSEVEILQKIKHPNIVKLVDFFEEEKTYYVILEYLPGGELFDRIVKKTFYNEKEARDLVSILLGAIKYCHDRDIVHRYNS